MLEFPHRPEDHARIAIQRRAQPRVETAPEPRFRVGLWAAIAAAAVIFTLALALSARAQSITFEDGATTISQTRGFERSGPYRSQWSKPAREANERDHQGRRAATFEDAGLGTVTFEILADRNGRAVAQFQDVGDTKNFKSFSVNGRRLDIPAPRENRGIFRVALDFGKAGWQRVTASTTLRAGLPWTRQDGFSVGVCRRKS